MTTRVSLPPVARRTRRVLVLTAYLGYAAMLLAWTLLEQPVRWLFVLPLGLAAILAMGMLLMPQLLGVSEGADEQLDERQIALRNRTYLNAYRVLGALVVLSALYYMLAQGGGWWLPRSDLETQAFFWGSWLIALTLPTAITAWTEPDLRE
jgi:hypothetical protein